jgi:NADPH:quinone reductase-like Zn-dependent oxidoreductase
MKWRAMEEMRTRIGHLPPNKVDELLSQIRPGRKFQGAITKSGAHSLRAFDPGRDENYRLQIDNVGVFDSLTCHVCPRIDPGPGEIEVEVHVGGMNFRDLMISLDLYPTSPGEIPALGADFAGKVVRVGKGVDEFKVGEEVVGMGRHCFSAYVTVEAQDVIRKPGRFSFDEAATIPVVFCTVYIALRSLADLWAGERVLIHSGTGGVGLAAIQYAKWIGAEVFATAGTEEKREYLRSIGVPHVMDSRTLDFGDEILAKTNGEGVDVVLNSLSGHALLKGLQVLRPFGRFVDIGKRDIIEDRQIGLFYFAKGISFSSVALGLMDRARCGFSRRMRTELTALFNSGALDALPRKRFAISEAAKAFSYMSEGKYIGKIVLLVKGQPVLVDPRRARVDNFVPPIRHFNEGIHI